jgi:hypothetical protein
VPNAFALEGAGRGATAFARAWANEGGAEIPAQVAGAWLPRCRAGPRSGALEEASSEDAGWAPRAPASKACTS